MKFFFTKEIKVTRNYDLIQSGFSPLPTKEEHDQEFCWNIDTIRDMFSLFSTIFFSAIGYGILTTLIAFKVESAIKNEILISISSACQISAGVFFARFLPNLGKKIGLVNAIYLASWISALCSILLYFYIDYFLWIALIFVFGMSLFISGVVRQTIMIELAPRHSKAMIISVGGMIVAIGNSLGPIVLAIFGTGNNFSSFFLASIIYLMSMLPMSRLKQVKNNVREEKKIGIWRYVKNSPKIMFAGFSVNYSLSSANAFLIIYGVRSGMNHDMAALLYSVLLFGTIFSIPVGYLTDIVNRRFLMIFSAFLSLICVFSLYFNENMSNIYLLLFLTFGAMIGIKLPAVVLINEKYKATQRLAVNSAFARFCLIGNIVGIFTTGAIMKMFGPKGLWLSMILVLSFFILFCTHNYWRKYKKGELRYL